MQRQPYCMRGSVGYLTTKQASDFIPLSHPLPTPTPRHCVRPYTQIISVSLQAVQVLHLINSSDIRSYKTQLSLEAGFRRLYSPLFGKRRFFVVVALFCFLFVVDVFCFRSLFFSFFFYVCFLSFSETFLDETTQ